MNPYTALLGGYHPFTRPQFTPGERPQAPPPPPPGEPSLFPQGGFLLPEGGYAGGGYDRDSASRGISNQASGWTDDTAGQNFISREPGSMSVMGLSHGSAYDDLGRAYDTANFDIGGAAGGLLGGFLGPLGGVAGGLLGRQLDINTVLGGSRSRDRDFGRGGVQNMSSGERRAFEEARQAVMSRPMPTNLTSTERGMRQGSAQFYSGGYGGGYGGAAAPGSAPPGMMNRDSNSRGSELRSYSPPSREYLDSQSGRRTR